MGNGITLQGAICDTFKNLAKNFARARCAKNGAGAKIGYIPTLQVQDYIS